MRHFIKLEKDYKKVGEINSGEKRLEKAGYLDTATLVRQMLLAGVRTNATKSTLFDLARGIDINDISEIPINPDRMYGFDYFEAVSLQESLIQNIKRQHKKAVEIKQAKEAAEKVAAEAKAVAEKAAA